MSDFYVANAQAVDPLSYENQGSVPSRSTGDHNTILSDTLFSGTSTISAWITSGYLGTPRETAIFISTVGGGNTATIECSLDNTNWYVAVNPYTDANAVVTLTDASDATNPTTGGTAVMRIEPTPYYRIKFSAATAVRVQHVLKF